EQYARAIEIVGADPSVDTLVVTYVPPMVTRPEEIAAAIARGAGTGPAEKPVLTVFLSSHGAPAALATGRRGRLPAYLYPEDAALALAAAERYGRWRRRPRGTVVELGRFEDSAVRAVIDRVLAGGDEPRWLPPADVARAPRAAGIAFAHGQQAAPGAARGVGGAWGFRGWPRRSRRASSTRAPWAASCSVSSRRRRSPMRWRRSASACKRSGFPSKGSSSSARYGAGSRPSPDR